MIKIWLDDERNPFEHTGEKGWVWCKTPVEFYGCVMNNINDIEEIAFDHDLGAISYGPLSAPMVGDELHGSFREGTILHKSGYECAFWFVTTYKLLRYKMPKMTCHSANPYGKERILALLTETEQNYRPDSMT